MKNRICGIPESKYMKGLFKEDKLQAVFPINQEDHMNTNKGFIYKIHQVYNLKVQSINAIKQTKVNITGISKIVPSNFSGMKGQYLRFDVLFNVNSNLWLYAFFCDEIKEAKKNKN